MTEIWLLAFPRAANVRQLATRAEEMGLSGVLFTDTQHLACDVYVALTAAAIVTQRLGLGTGVTNPVTRHASVTASAIATVQELSKGRAVLGIGRGDSSLAYIGQEPVAVRRLEAYIRHVDAYLKGRPPPDGAAVTANHWIAQSDAPKVPIDVAATGPRVMALGARTADRLTFAVGADPERVEGSIEAALRARRDSERASKPLSLGAYVNIVPHPDERIACELVRGGLASFARFSAMGPTGVAGKDAQRYESLGRDYDSAYHGMATAPHTEAVDDDFVKRFGIVGDPDRCVDRLQQLGALGLDRIVLVCGSRDADPREMQVAHGLLQTHVVPSFLGA